MDVPEANQKLQPIRDQFLVRFYKWAKEDSRREFSEGFPFIRQIRNLTTLRFLHFAESLQKQERTALSSGLLKRSHQRAIELEHDFPTEEEEAVLNRYSNWKEDQAGELGSQSHRTKKAKFRKMLSGKVAPILGIPIEDAPNRETSVYRTQINCWAVRTWIDTGGSRLVSYSHSVDARESVQLHDNISILSWLGIAQTDWTYVQESEEGQVVECLVELCAHFVRAVPKLLDGLSHDLAEPDVREWRELVTVKGHRENGMTIVTIDTPKLRMASRGKATWDIPTSIVPERLRAVGSHFTIVQDPSFSRESADPLALSPT
jgi:hypothetical protein